MTVVLVILAVVMVFGVGLSAIFWLSWPTDVTPTAFSGVWLPRRTAPQVDAVIGYDAKAGTVVVLWRNGEQHRMTWEAADQFSAALYVASMEARDEPFQAGGRP